MTHRWTGRTKRLFCFPKDDHEDPISQNDELHIYWNPLEETRKDAYKRICTEVREYLNYVEAVVSNAGWDKAPNLYEKDGKKDEKNPLIHFEWLAMYQVLKKTLPQIAEKYFADKLPSYPDANTYHDKISKGIDTAAELLGITPRRGSRGAPKK